MKLELQDDAGDAVGFVNMTKNKVCVRLGMDDTFGTVPTITISEINHGGHSKKCIVLDNMESEYVNSKGIVEVEES